MADGDSLVHDMTEYLQRGIDASNACDGAKIAERSGVLSTVTSGGTKQPYSTFEEYLQIDAVNVSTLKLMGESPRAYRHAIESGLKEKPAFALGSATHTAILEPEKFNSEYAVQPESRINDNGEEVKFVRNGRHWVEFQQQNAGKRIITADEHAMAWRASRLVHQHEDASRALAEHGEFETSLTWVDKITGLKCKCRVDHLAISTINELKTARNITLRNFERDVHRFRYHWGAAFYQDGVREVTGYTRKFAFIVVETSEVMDVGVLDAEQDMIDLGRKEYRSALDEVARCLDSGKWPGKLPTRVSVTVPAYAFGDDESDLISV